MKDYFHVERIKQIPPLHITVDKRGIKDFPKLPSATSFIRQPLDEIQPLVLKRLMPIFNVKEVEPWVKISMHI